MEHRIVKIIWRIVLYFTLCIVKLFYFVLGIVVVFSFLALSVYLPYCAGMYDFLINRNAYLFRKNLVQALDSGRKTVLLSSVTNFKWDKVCFYVPYSYEGKNKCACISDDNTYHVEFMLNKSVVLVSELNAGFFLWHKDKHVSGCVNNQGSLVVKDGRIASLSDLVANNANELYELS